MELLYRFLIGGLVVSAFAIIGDLLRPKSFAGLFGAAPSVALATLCLTILDNGKYYAAAEARSMMLGGLGFLIYAVTCVYVMGKRHVAALPATITLIPLWAIGAFGLWWVLLRSAN